VLTEIPESQVAKIIVVYPMTWVTEDGDALVDPKDFLSPWEQLDDGAIQEFNKFILQNSEVIYSAPWKTATRWHGTSLSIARKAYPDLVTLDLYRKGLRAGSVWSAETWQAWEDFEDEEEDND
jgi:hypothetical protein